MGGAQCFELYHLLVYFFISQNSTILNGIDQLANWGNRLYEGAPISASLGFCKTSAGHKPEFGQVNDCDFAAVLSNGYDTISVFDYDGGFVGHEALSGIDDFLPHAPMRQSAIAGRLRLLVWL